MMRLLLSNLLFRYRTYRNRIVYIYVDLSRLN